MFIDRAVLVALVALTELNIAVYVAERTSGKRLFLIRDVHGSGRPAGRVGSTRRSMGRVYPRVGSGRPAGRVGSGHRKWTYTDISLSR